MVRATTTSASAVGAVRFGSDTPVGVLEIGTPGIDTGVPKIDAEWAPPAGVPSLKGENREEFLQSCDGWYRSDKG